MPLQLGKKENANVKIESVLEIGMIQEYLFTRDLRNSPSIHIN